MATTICGFKILSGQANIGNSTEWLAQIVCLIEATCLPADRFFSELALKLQLSMLFYYKADAIIIYSYAYIFNLLKVVKISIR
jgi:hypothetical protein